MYHLYATTLWMELLQYYLLLWAFANRLSLSLSVLSSPQYVVRTKGFLRKSSFWVHLPLHQYDPFPLQIQSISSGKKCWMPTWVSQFRTEHFSKGVHPCILPRKDSTSDLWTSSPLGWINYFSFICLWQRSLITFSKSIQWLFQGSHLKNTRHKLPVMLPNQGLNSLQPHPKDLSAVQALHQHIQKMV